MKATAMTPEEILAAIKSIGDTTAASISALNDRCTALADSVEKLTAAKAKADNEDDDMAQPVAADSVSRGELNVVKDQLRALQMAQPARVSPATRDQMADAQAKADVAYGAIGERASPPMQSEGLIEYQIRLHRGLQSHTKRFKNASLHALAADSATFATVCDSIRAEAYEAGISPVGMPLFQHREIKTMSPGGHHITTFVGNGTIFKQLTRPAKYVTGIGANDKMPRSGGGSMYAPGH